jgi:uncharacterized protein (DUF4415 family)
MKGKYSFDKGKRGAVAPAHRKVRISIRLDPDVVAWFKKQVEVAGGGNYQSLMNEALRAHISNEGEDLEKVLRRVIREEIHPDGKAA